MKAKTKNILKDLDNETQPPKNCGKCKGVLREIDLYSGFDYDVHQYEVCTGYKCPHCGYEENERISV